MFRYLVFFILLTAPRWAISQTVLTGKVIKVADGDTFTLLTEDNQQIRIRLHGIDAPEKSQPYSQVSRSFLNEKIYGKMVKVEQMDIDKYKRIVGMVFIDGVNINEALLRGGMVWHYKKYDKNTQWAKWETEAREKKLGIWADSQEPVAPWDFRHPVKQ